jgi:hydroxylysine kinase
MASVIRSRAGKTSGAEALTEETHGRSVSPSGIHPRALLHNVFGLSGSVERLPSEMDETYRVLADDGVRYTLKVAGADERADVLRFQTEILQHLAKAAPSLPVPKVMPAPDGQAITAIEVDGRTRLVRLLGWVDGVPMHSVPGSTAQMTSLGQSLGALDNALASSTAEVPAIELIWDIGRAGEVAEWAHEIDDPAVRRLTLDAFARAAELNDFDGSLPRQVIHNDINPHNIIVSADNQKRVTGIIDFGDIILAPRINDLAVALSYQVGLTDGLERTAAFIAGYGREVALSPPELDTLLPKILARLAMTVAITTHRAAASPGHAVYILRNRPVSIAGLQRLAAVSPSTWAALLQGKAQ